MTDSTIPSPFGFALEPNRCESDPDQLLESFVQAQLQGLLDIVVLTSNGKPVDVNGFIWTRDAFRRTTDATAAPIPINRKATV